MYALRSLLVILFLLLPAFSFALVDPAQEISSSSITSSPMIETDMSSVVSEVNISLHGEDLGPGYSLENSCVLPGHDVNLCSPVEDDVISFDGVASDGTCGEEESLGSDGCCYNRHSVISLMCTDSEMEYRCVGGRGSISCTSETGEPSLEVATPTFIPSKAECRSNNYNLSHADCSGIKEIDDGIRLRMQNEFAAKKARCEQHISTALGVDCKTVAADTSAGGDTASSAGQLSCKASEQLNASLSEARSRVQACKGKLESCSSVCNIRVGGPEAFFTALTEQRGPQCTSQLQPAYAGVSSSLSNMASTAEAETARCQALSDSPDEDPNADYFSGSSSSYAGSAKAGSYGSYGSAGGSELGYNTGKAIAETAKGIYDKSKSYGNLNPGSGIGSHTSGLPDDAVFGGGSNKAYSPKSGGPGGRSGAGKTSAGSFGGGSGNSAKVGANTPRRRFKSAKSRNLAQGYKSVKASDGGSSVSVKGADFKRFGSKTLKSKLAEARKLHGKDLPLIFKNGKFVLDFLAMKESSKFKARTSSMESYLKGGQRKAASVADLNVHQDAKLNIFKIMNFRYQRQSFNTEKK